MPAVMARGSPGGAATGARSPPRAAQRRRRGPCAGDASHVSYVPPGVQQATGCTRSGVQRQSHAGSPERLQRSPQETTPSQQKFLRGGGPAAPSFSGRNGVHGFGLLRKDASDDGHRQASLTGFEPGAVAFQMRIPSSGSTPSPTIAVEAYSSIPHEKDDW